MHVFRDVKTSALQPSVSTTLIGTFPGGIGPVPPLPTIVTAPWTRVVVVPHGLWLLHWRGALISNLNGLSFRLAFVELADPPQTPQPGGPSYLPVYGLKLFDGDDEGLTVVRGPCEIYASHSTSSTGLAFSVTQPNWPMFLQVDAVAIDSNGEPGSLLNLQNELARWKAILPGVGAGGLTTERQIVRFNSIPAGRTGYLGVDIPPAATGASWYPTSTQVQGVVFNAGTAEMRVNVRRPGYQVTGGTIEAMEAGSVGHNGRDIAGYSGAVPTGAQTNNLGPLPFLSVENPEATAVLQCTVVLEKGPINPIPPALMAWPRDGAVQAGVGPAFVQILAPNASRSYLRVENRGAAAGWVRFGNTDPNGYLLGAGLALERWRPCPAASVQVAVPAGASDFIAWEETA